MRTLNTMNSMQTPNPTRRWPMTEKLMRDFRLPSTKRRLIQTSDYHDCNHEHDRQSLILVFVDEYAGDLAGAHTRAHSRTSSSSLLLDLARLYILSV